MSSIIYKQTFKPRSASSTPGLNVRHVQYIATRPGVVPNKGCGFGLWGQLPGQDTIRVQNDFVAAKQTVRNASAEHTLYRAIISVGKEDAENYGLYDRGRWEQLINNHIDVVAREMDIRPNNLCWLAAMHNSQGHPHVHLLYWDNSNQPRQEYMPKAEFEKKSERIRAVFAGDIHRDEILENQQIQAAEAKLLRASIQAMCADANPERILNLTKLSQSTWLDDASADMAELIRQLPARGSLRYAYLPADYKALVDQFVERCLERPDFAEELAKYRSATDQISELYANGDETAARNADKAMQKLRKELGNQVMDAIREIRDEISADAPQTNAACQALIREAVDLIAPATESYQQLQQMLPAERIPRGCMGQIDGYYKQLNRVAEDVLKDARLRIRLQNYALNMAQIDLDNRPSAGKRDADEPHRHFLNGKELTEQEWQSYQDFYSEAKRELRSQITDKVREDAGWNNDAVRSGTAMMVYDIFRLLSRLTGQKQAGVSLARLKRLLSKDKSQEAKKEEQKKHEFESEWDEF